MAHVLHTGQVEKLHLRIGGEGALAMTFDMVHWIAKQVLWFVCLFNFLLLLLFCVLKSCQMFLCMRVYVLGIISHKLFPPWLLKGCSDSNWNRLEISREAWSGECLGQGGGDTWAARWMLGNMTIRIQLRADVPRESHLPPGLLWLLSTGLKHMLLLEANAEADTKFIQLPNR